MHQFLQNLQDPVPRAIAGFLLAAIVATIANRAKVLTPSGASASILVGGAVVAGAGWWAGAILIIYFITSSALSSLVKRTREPDEQARGKRRDAWQVLANGGVAATCSLAMLLVGNPAPLYMATIGSIAGAAADTWATELGRFSRSAPRLVTTWQKVPAGTSGAISNFGTLASLGGAIFIGLLAGASNMSVNGLSWFQVVGLISVAGVAGSLTDSVLGALVQERRWCPACHQPTEQPTHRCGTPTDHVGGVPWMNNDVVNAAAVLLAATVSGLGTVILG